MKRYTSDFHTCFRCPMGYQPDGHDDLVHCAALGRYIEDGCIPDDCPLPDAPEEDKEKEKT